MPPVVSSVLMRCVPSAASANQLLSDSLSAVEWATARHVIALLRAALALGSRNGLTVHALAEAAAAYWFPSAGAVQTELAANRIAFVMTLLDPPGDEHGAEVAGAAACVVDGEGEEGGDGMAGV